MIKLYSNNCPLCGALKKRLLDANIEFVEENDEDKMIEHGIKAVPMLQLKSGELLTYKEALQWLKEALNEQD